MQAGLIIFQLYDITDSNLAGKCYVKFNNRMIINWGRLSLSPSDFSSTRKDYPVTIRVPYQELGLELVNPDYPPVPETILVSGTFRFDYQMECRFNFDHCGKYRLRFSVSEGRVKLYAGSSRVGAEIYGDYEAIFDWEKASYIRLVGLDGLSMVRIDAEIAD